MADKVINCQWENCSKQATVQLFSHDERQQAWFCGEHRRAAIVNLELHGTLFAPKSTRGQGIRPGVPPPMAQITPSARPGQLDNKSWEKKAAQQAEAASKPLEEPKPTAAPKRISNVPAPRKMP